LIHVSLTILFKATDRQSHEGQPPQPTGKLSTDSGCDPRSLKL